MFGGRKMPVYEYSCSVCGKVFERNLSFSDSQSTVKCPSGHTHVQRVYSPIAVVFKGSGFYSTDHSHHSSGDISKS